MRDSENKAAAVCVCVRDSRICDRARQPRHLALLSCGDRLVRCPNGIYKRNRNFSENVLNEIEEFGAFAGNGPGMDTRRPKIVSNMIPIFLCVRKPSNTKHERTLSDRLAGWLHVTQRLCLSGWLAERYSPSVHTHQRELEGQRQTLREAENESCREAIRQTLDPAQFQQS